MKLLGIGGGVSRQLALVVLDFGVKVHQGGVRLAIGRRTASCRRKKIRVRCIYTFNMQVEKEGGKVEILTTSEDLQ